MELHQDRQSPLMMRCPLGKWIQGAQLYPSPTNTAKTEPFKAPSFTSTSISAGCIHSWEISLKKEELHFFIFVFKQQHVFPNEFGTQPPDMIRCPPPPPTINNPFLPAYHLNGPVCPAIADLTDRPHSSELRWRCMKGSRAAPWLLEVKWLGKDASLRRRSPQREDVSVSSCAS